MMLYASLFRSISDPAWRRSRACRLRTTGRCPEQQDHYAHDQRAILGPRSQPRDPDRRAGSPISAQDGHRGRPAARLSAFAPIAIRAWCGATFFCSSPGAGAIIGTLVISAAYSPNTCGPALRFVWPRYADPPTSSTRRGRCRRLLGAQFIKVTLALAAPACRRLVLVCAPIASHLASRALAEPHRRGRHFRPLEGLVPAAQRLRVLMFLR